MLDAPPIRFRSRKARARTAPRPVPAKRQDADVEREILHQIADVERHTTAANLICLALTAGAATTLPFSGAFILPILVRIAMMINTKLSFDALRRALEGNQDLRRAMYRMTAALVLAGIAWGSMLIPLLVYGDPHPARLFAGGATLIGVSIVASLLSPVLLFSISFFGGFAVTLAGALLWTRAGADTLLSLVGMAGFCAIFVAYSRATATGMRNSAALLMENRHMNSKLAEALAEAEYLAKHDPLTGLRNRRSLFEQAGAFSADVDRHVMLVDLDHFKAINDRFGHATGDLVLEETGKVLREMESQIDSIRMVAARIGGEEFALIIDTPDGNLAALCADRLRVAIALIASQLDNASLRTGASIGLARWHPGAELGAVLNDADVALYQAKQAGRNRVVVAADGGAARPLHPVHRKQRSVGRSPPIALVHG